MRVMRQSLANRRWKYSIRCFLFKSYQYL